MSKSHTTPPKPSVLLALVCLAIIKRLRPQWVCITVGQAARSEQISPQRVSRLCSHLIEPISALLARHSTRGRPSTVRTEQRDVQQLALTQALLQVATQLLKSVRLHKPAVAALVVGAYLGLKQTHPQLTQKHFCATLGIAQRTVRYWLTAGLPTQTTASAQIPAEPPRRSPKRQRRGRFGFDVTVPGTQLAADTTDLAAFGCPLKLMAAQDVGGRDQNLLDAVIVQTHENSDQIVELLTDAIGDKEGMQVIVDQGTPYLAEQTRAACDQLEAELAVQREGHPQGKATLERAFGSIKQIAAPIFELTGRIAAALPSLQNAALAQACATLMLTALLRAYQAGARAAARADAARLPADAHMLAQVAERARHRARADDHSTRLLLTHIHSAYQIDTGITSFIRTFRRFPLTVIQQAERAFAQQAHRGDIKKRTSYFAAIVRAKFDAWLADRDRKLADQALADKLDTDAHRAEKQRAAWQHNPTAHLRDALKLLAAQVDPQSRTLRFGGSGIGRAALAAAWNALLHRHGFSAAAQIAHAVERDFRSEFADTLGPDGLRAVTDLVHQRLADLRPPRSANQNHHCLAAFRKAILPTVGPSKSRPPPSVPLRI
jgi:hypothetical protein